METKQLINEEKIIEDFNISNNDFYIEKENNILFIKSKNKKNWKSFNIEFDSLIKRQKEFQTIIKAFGIKNNYKPNILDTTAGMGRDSFILANSGCSITMIERNPIIYLLLKNSIENCNNEKTKKILTKIKLIYDDSINFLSKNELNNIDIIYIDTMFPKTNKNRLTKKNMQIFQNIVGEDLDDKELLEISLKQNVKKIIVKRMLKMNYIDNKKPTFEIKGSKIRFDVYIKNNIL